MEIDLDISDCRCRSRSFSPGPRAGNRGIVSQRAAPTALRRGVATRLLLFALADLAAEGVEDVTLEVAVDNVPARALYDRVGFSEAGRRPGYYRRDRELVDAMVMHRRL